MTNGEKYAYTALILGAYGLVRKAIQGDKYDFRSDMADKIQNMAGIVKQDRQTYGKNFLSQDVRRVNRSENDYYGNNDYNDDCDDY